MGSEGFRPAVAIVDETQRWLCPATLIHGHGEDRCLLPSGHTEPSLHWTQCELCAEYGDDMDLHWDDDDDNWTVPR